MGTFHLLLAMMVNGLRRDMALSRCGISPTLV
jgi:hypothetical protein